VIGRALENPTMNRMLAGALALSLLGAGAGAAAARDHDHGGRGDRWEHGDRGRHGDQDDDRWEGHDRGRHLGHYKKWKRGERVVGYRYVVIEPYRYHLRRPPVGYRWVRVDDGDFLLTAIATGLIVDMVVNAD
jgi:Ni/Co efflux regulator RcnB